MNFLKTFEEDCKYYDLKKKELKAIIKKGKINDKIVLDIGAGIGRLSIPLSKYAKKVIALDYDKRFKKYFKGNSKIKFVNKKVENYLKGDKKFERIILAWPVIDSKFLDLIKNSMNKESKFIFITCNSKSDYESVIDKLNITYKHNYNIDVQNKEKFLQLLPKKFKVAVNKKIKTNYIFPNKDSAYRILKNSIMLWFKIKLNKNMKNKLAEIINNHKKGEKIIFKEEIFFYILKLK
jgi:16S rRNA G966 N2-methylase RsmD